MPDKTNEGLNWSDEELDLIVSDYFQMLNDEAAGRPLNKARNNRLLQSKIDRSRSSIEFKHRNISAVLVRLGMPRITGYFPAENYQKTITASIDRYISQNPAVLHPENAANNGNTFAERAGLFVEPPPALSPVTPQREDIERLVRKFNPVERDFRNRKLGRDGEELVLNFERERLKQFERPDLVKKIREVKTTVGPDATPFYITRNELSFSSERPDAFRLCRVFDFSMHPRMFELAPPLEKFVHLSPLSYEASFS